MIKRNKDNSFSIGNNRKGTTPFLTVLNAVNEKHSEELRRQDRLFPQDKQQNENNKEQG